MAPSIALPSRTGSTSSGTVSIGGVDVTAVTGRRLRRLRRDFQMIFQDPFESLPANSSALDVVLAGLRIHRDDLDGAGRRAAAVSALESIQPVVPLALWAALQALRTRAAR